jgi:asparagine synthase (glutamine-hydrolysing)
MTAFADIWRLPPAHTLTCEEGKIFLRRYWQLSVTTPILFHREEEYIERFRELLDAAVADRVRSGNVGVLMSGGLDSPTVAASANRIVTRNGAASDVRAYTGVFESLIPHEERHYAGLVAEALGIPIEFFLSDGFKIFEHADESEYHAPEPSQTAWPDITRIQLGQASARGGVVLTGFGADPALCGRITVHFRKMLEQRRLGRLLQDAARFVGAEGRFSRLYISTRWRLVFASRKWKPPYPQWINENLEKEFGLKDRWEQSDYTSTQTSEFAVRPEAHDAVAAPMWVSLFESFDAGFTGIPVEVCHPIFDLRLLKFLLALPRLPWCSDKELLREAARGVLPDRVRLRRKSPLPADHVVALLKRPESAWVDNFDPIPELERYVVRNRIPPVARETDSWAVWTNLRPLSLNYWLRQDALWSTRLGRGEIG